MTRAVKVYLTSEEYEVLCRYAKIDTRGHSELLRHALKCLVKRNRKNDVEWPEED